MKDDVDSLIDMSQRIIDAVSPLGQRGDVLVGMALTLGMQIITVPIVKREETVRQMKALIDLGLETAIRATGGDN